MNNITVLNKYKEREDILILRVIEKETGAFSEIKERTILRQKQRRNYSKYIWNTTPA